ncbi:hypothetical protein ACJMK2_034745 [Sinanodonta woodiana]|uniref:Uncharacterized protein n=1 Tax=Sinanodonta woodiana TaxID=1069815 RepID=A0ABD3WSP4_SINWO
MKETEKLMESDTIFHIRSIEHNATLSIGNTIQSLDETKYSIIRPQDSTDHWDLQVGQIQLYDQGHYKCMVTGTSISVTHLLSVIGSPSVPRDLPILNKTDCCMIKNVSSDCLPACSATDLSRYIPLMHAFSPRCSTEDVYHIIECGTDGRSHIGCCLRQDVADFCLGLCTANFDVIPDYARCIPNEALSIISCMQEGQLTLPSPPASVSVAALSNGNLLVSWKAPLQNAANVTGFRVYFRKASEDTFKFSSVLSVSATYYIIGNLEINVLYDVYVISTSNYGTSLRSILVQVATIEGTPVVEIEASIKTCCVEKNISADCQFYCRQETYMSRFHPEKLFQCFGELPKISQCLVGHKNHTPCCQRFGIPLQCQGLCSGQPVDLNVDLAVCMTNMPLIEACIEEGNDKIPSPPKLVTVTDITYNNAVVTWEKPDGLPEPSSYVVIYSLYGSERMEIETVNGYRALLSELSSAAVYAVHVTSQNSNGSSLPSPKIVFVTDDMPGAVPTQMPYTQNNITACCSKYMPANRSECLSLCDPTSITPSFELALRCVDFILPMLECASDKRNHTSCCVQNNLAVECLPICEYNGGDLPESFIICAKQREYNIISQCYMEGLVSKPRPPTQLTVKNYSTDTVLLVWRPPLGGPMVDRYTVQYTLDVYDQGWTSVSTQKTFYSVSNLQPGMRYFFKVHSVNANGTSLPTPTVSVQTMKEIPPDIIPGLTINWTAVWQNRTQCCQNSNMSDTCSAKCISGEINPHVCMGDIRKTIACAADGRDHRLCCLNNNVPFSCQSYCVGQVPSQDYVSGLCLGWAGIILSCLSDGQGLLPTPPQNLTVTNITSQSISLQWDTPSQNCNASVVCMYEVMLLETSSSNTEPLSIYETERKNYTISNLKSLTSYTLLVRSKNQHGLSLPGPSLIVVTTSNSFKELYIVQNPSGVINSGASVTLKCDAFGDVGVNSVIWTFYDNTVGRSNVLILKNVAEEQAGLYTCTVIYDDGEIRIANARLNIKYKPVASNITELVVDPGLRMTASLRCLFKGFPEMIVWTKDSSSLMDYNRVYTEFITDFESGFSTGRLQIRNFEASDYGRYTCTGVNSFGNGSIIGILQSNYSYTTPLTPTQRSNVTECCLNKSIPLDCVGGICTFDVDLYSLILDNSKWRCLAYLQGYVSCASDGKDHTSCCRKKQISDFCLPLCYGVIPRMTEIMQCVPNITAMLDCIEEGHANIPSAPTNVNASQYYDRIIISWKAPISNHEKVQFYQVTYTNSKDNTVGNIKLGSSVQGYNISNLIPMTTYAIIVKAGNDFGTNNDSKAIQVDINVLPPGRPQNVRGQLVEYVFVRLIWDPPTSENSITGYNISYCYIEGSRRIQQHTTVEATFPTIRLGRLRYNTEYEIYVTAYNNDGSGERSDVYRIKTAEVTTSLPPKTQKQVEAQNETVGLAVGLSILMLLLIAVAVIGFFCYRRQRSKGQVIRESVYFENPQYGNNQSAQISGISDNTSENGFGYTTLEEESRDQHCYESSNSSDTRQDNLYDNAAVNDCSQAVSLEHPVT